MSIATAITAAQGRVANAYTAVSNKGGTLPATQNLTNLPDAINSIPGGDTITATNISSAAISSGDKVWIETFSGHESGQVGNGASVFYPMVKTGKVGYSGNVYQINSLKDSDFTQLYSAGYYYNTKSTVYLQPYGKNPVLIDGGAYYTSLGDSSSSSIRSFDLYNENISNNWSVGSDGYIWVAGYHIIRGINPNTLSIDYTYNNINKASTSLPYVKSGNYFILAKFRTSDPQWTYVYNLESTQQTDWTISGDTDVQNVCGAFAVTDSLFIVPYKTYSRSSAPTLYSSQSADYSIDGVALMEVNSTNKTVVFKTTSLTGDIANWSNGVSGNIFVTYNANNKILCLCQAFSSSPNYSLFKYENGSWTSLSLDLTGVLPSGNYFTSGISVSDDGKMISFGYGASSTSPDYNANREQAIYDLEEKKTYAIKDFYGTTQNFITAGNLTITNRVASGFSSSSYLKLQNVFNPGNNTWEAVFRVKTGNDVDAFQCINGSGVLTGADCQGFCIDVSSVKFLYFISSNGTSWDIASAKFGETSLQTNTWYYVKLEFTGSAYILSVSTDGTSYTQDAIVASSQKIFVSSQPMAIGGNFYNSLNEAPWKGSIDLSQSYIKINGSNWWVPYVSNITQDMFTGIAQEAIAVSGTGEVKTILPEVE